MAEIATEARVTEAPEVATSKSTIPLAAGDCVALATRAHPAVPVATAVPAVMAFAVRTPDEATPKPFEAPVSVTKRVPVAAESGDAGCVPV